MRSSFIAAIVAVSVIASASIVCHASVSARKSSGQPAFSSNNDLMSIRAIYQTRSYGFLTRNSGQLYSSAAADFLLTDRNGARFSRAAALQRAGAAMSTLSRSIGSGSDPQALSGTVDILSMTLSGGQAIVIESSQLHALSVSDASASTYASASGVFNGVYRDVWVRTPQGWLQKSSRKL